MTEIVGGWSVSDREATHDSQFRSGIVSMVFSNVLSHHVAQLFDGFWPVREVERYCETVSAVDFVIPSIDVVGIVESALTN